MNLCKTYKKSCRNLLNFRLAKKYERAIMKLTIKYTHILIVIKKIPKGRDNL